MDQMKRIVISLHVTAVNFDAKIIAAFPQDGIAMATKIAPMGQMKTIAQLLHVQRTNLSAPREVPMRRLNVLIKPSFVTAKKTVKMALMKEQLALPHFAPLSGVSTNVDPHLKVVFVCVLRGRKLPTTREHA
jgi:hypothetical protein